MSVRFHSVTRSNNKNERELAPDYSVEGENSPYGRAPWPKGEFIGDPEGLRREAAEMVNANSENAEDRLAMAKGPYVQRFRKAVARRATNTGMPVIVEGFVITDVVEDGTTDENGDKNRYAKMCDLATGVCWLVAISALGVAHLLLMKGGKTRRRRHRQRKTRSKAT